MFTPIHRALGLEASALTWNLLEQAVRQRVKETTDLDWKRTLYQPKDPKWQYEASKDVAAMANSGGGWIVFGVADKDDRADEITGVKWSSVEEQRLRKIAALRILPPVTGLEFFEQKNPEGTLAVAFLKVPEHGGSLHVVCPDSNTYKVPYRNGPDTEFHGPRVVGSALLAVADGSHAAAVEPDLDATPVDLLKGWLHDDTKAVRLHDLVMAEVAPVVEAIGRQALATDHLDGDAFETILDEHRQLVEPLINLLVTGIWYDDPGLRDRVWVDALQRLVTAGGTPVYGKAMQSVLFRARLYPALLTFYSMGVAAVSRGRERLLIKLSTEVLGKMFEGGTTRISACQALHPLLVLDGDWINAMPRWAGGRWTYPQSHLLQADTRPYFTEFIPEAEEFTRTFHAVEYRLGLLQEQTQSDGYRAMNGEFVGETGWTFGRPTVPLAENEFRAAGARDPNWPWFEQLGGQEEYEGALESYRSTLENYKYHRMP